MCFDSPIGYSLKIETHAKAKSGCIDKYPVVKATPIAQPNPADAAAKKGSQEEIDILCCAGCGGRQRLKDATDCGLHRITFAPAMKLQMLVHHSGADDSFSRGNRVAADERGIKLGFMGEKAGHDLSGLPDVVICDVLAGPFRIVVTMCGIQGITLGAQAPA